MKGFLISFRITVIDHCLMNSPTLASFCSRHAVLAKLFRPPHPEAIVSGVNSAEGPAWGSYNLQEEFSSYKGTVCQSDHLYILFCPYADVES
jgi:hypothetical protein